MTCFRLLVSRKCARSTNVCEENASRTALLRNLLGGYLFAVPGDEAPLFNIVFTDDADRLVAELRNRNVGAVRQYRSIAQHPAYANLAETGFPQSDWWTDRAVYLPFGLALTEDDANRIGEAVLDTKIELITA